MSQLFEKVSKCAVEKDGIWPEKEFPEQGERQAGT
jgi:hypothetical protein